MARTYWRVSPAFWSDEKVSKWSDDAKLLGLYILTCDHRTLEGLFRLPKGYIQEDLGWSAERLAQPFAQLLLDGFIEYDEANRICLIVHALEYQQPENPNQVTSAVKIIEELPETPLFARIYAQSELLCERLAERLRKRFPERLGEGFAKPPTPTPTPALLSEGAPSSGDTPVENFGDEARDPEVELQHQDDIHDQEREDNRTQGQRLVAMYVDERAKVGSEPTRTQIGIIAKIIGEKLEHGAKPERLQEAIKRMIRKGKPPSTLPAFVDEVEAEKAAAYDNRPRSTYVPDTFEPTEEDRVNAAEILRQARESLTGARVEA